MKLVRLAALSVVLGAVVACTTTEIVTIPAGTVPEGERPFGAVCTADDQCADGLACKEHYLNDACSAQKTCTVACTSDTACAALDPIGKCMEGCNEDKVCLRVQRQTTDLPLGAYCDGDEECSEGLECLQGIGSKETCAEKATCTTSCTKDAECAELFEGAKCMTGCNGKKLCVRTKTE